MRIIIVQDNRLVNARLQALRGLYGDLCEVVKTADMDLELRLVASVAAASTMDEIFRLAPLGELVEELSWE